MTGPSRLLALASVGALSLLATSASANGPSRPASAADAPAAPTDSTEPYTSKPRALTPQSERTTTQPNNRPTLAWFFTQLVPSIGMWVGPEHQVEVGDVRKIVAGQPLPADVAPGQRFFDHRGGVPRLALSWQVTPILYSFGVNRRVSPWRFLVVDPLARVSGSIELHFSPEWMPSATDTHLYYRAGFRTTLPIWQHGEYVALSVGAQYTRYEGKGGIVYEGGFSFLFGTIGVMLSHSPAFPDLRYGIRLNLKYF